MTQQLTPEQSAALHSYGTKPMPVVDPATNHVYLVVDQATHHQAMNALRERDDEMSIRRGIEDVESASWCAHSRENGRPRFKVELWDKLVNLGRGNSHRILFTIQSETIFVLTVRSTGQDDLTPHDLPANFFT